ncbi:VOC family protein [Williamsia sp. MIQD14]|uniref:VOC family protein n=1 Tax=Williamsia sp. MIQD14 TaxID=3425703 RepID=UPI003DA0CC33
MATGNTTVWVPVRDMDRALEFYRDTLGLAVKSTGSDWSEIDAGTLTIGLNGREETSPRGDAGGAVLTFQPDGTIDDEVSALRDKGVEFPGGISDHEWGRIAPFADPDGNDLQLYAPPS